MPKIPTVTMHTSMREHRWHKLQVSTAAADQLGAFFWVSTPFSRCVFWWFTETYCLHLQGIWILFMWMMRWLGWKECVSYIKKAGGNLATCTFPTADLQNSHSWNFLQLAHYEPYPSPSSKDLTGLIFSNFHSLTDK